MGSESLEEAPPSPKPSFEGRLRLTDYAFKPEASQPDNGSPRAAAAAAPRSARISAPAAGRPSASPSQLPPSTAPSSSPRTPKRKADGASAPASPSPNKKPRSGAGRQRPKAGYAPPATYAHLPHLPDAIAPNLLVLFVGLNPGVETARTGHAYAHRSNLFWKLMASSGVTPVACRAEEDRSLPQRFALGLTNIVARPSRNGAELSKGEMDAGVAVLEEKARRWRPEVACLVGKGIWESVWRVRHGRPVSKDEFKYGWQDEAENMGVVEGDPAGLRGEDRQDGVEYSSDWRGARVFVASSTSGLAATLLPAEKEKIWRELGVWVEKRRAEREAAKKAGDEDASARRDDVATNSMTTA